MITSPNVQRSKSFKRSGVWMSLCAALFAANTAQATDPLDYVPANSPYVFAALEPAPEAFTERMKQYWQPMAGSFSQLMRQAAMKDVDQSPEAKAHMNAVLALMDEFSSYFIDDKRFTAAGFKQRGRMAIYGQGLVPVIRVEIADAAKVSTTVQDVLNKIVKLDASSIKNTVAKGSTDKTDEQAVAKPFSFQRGKFRSGSLFKIGQEALQLFIHVEGDQLVIGVMPKSANAQMMTALLPAKAASSSARARVNSVKAKYGYGGYGIGYVDIAALTESYLGKATPLEKAFAKAVESDAFDKAPSAQCQTEIRSMVSNMPFFATGFTKLDANQFVQAGVLELKPSVAAEYASAVTPMPGYGEGALFRFAMAIDVLSLSTALRSQSQRIIDAPYKCETLQSMNAEAKKLQDGLANPMLGMAAMVKGFGVSVEDMTMPAKEGDMPTNATGNLAVFTDQPETLMAMAAGQVPGMAELNLKIGDAPKAAPKAMLESLPPGSVAGGEVFAAMSKNTVLLGFGKNRPVEMKRAMAAPASSGGEVYEIGYGAKIFQLFLDASVSADKNPEMSAEERAQLQKIMSSVFDQFQSVGSSMSFTKRGIEFVSDTKMKPMK